MLKEFYFAKPYLRRQKVSRNLRRNPRRITLGNRARVAAVFVGGVMFGKVAGAVVAIALAWGGR